MRDAAHDRLPNFIAVGPQRTGTTWLDAVLRGHACLPRGTKETDFFTKHYAKGLDWYRDYFRHCDGRRPAGEIDPNYFGDAVARDRIAAALPHCRIICTFRDPAERAYSSFRTMRRDAWTRVGFEETVARSEVIRESSRYAHHLRQWQERFGAERVLVLLYDDLEADAQGFLDRVCDFIAIERIDLRGVRFAGERLNAVTVAPRSRRIAQNARNARDFLRERRWHRTLALLDVIGVWRICFGGGEEFAPMDAEVESRMRERFRDEVEALEAHIGRDLSAWKYGRSAAGRAGVADGARRPA